VVLTGQISEAGLRGKDHATVLLEPAVSALLTDLDGRYVDGTFGRGGHSARLLDLLGETGRLLAIDRDPEAIAAARERLAADTRFTIRQGAFSRLAEFVDELGWRGEVAGVLLDLGVSSPQLDQPERGFSFLHDGPLDMRMDPEHGQSAAEWLATAGEREIADVLFHYGEERHSRRIARAIVNARQQQPITRTLQFADLVKEANPAWEKHKHPATRSFQAVRIFINRELEELEQCLQQAFEVLRPGGRLVVISFHSLEDRMVKRFIRRLQQRDDLPRGLPVPDSQVPALMRRLGKPVRADAGELAQNPRARSAVMRVAEKT